MAAVNFWGTQVPATVADNSVTLGVKFKANVAGTITHLRYYEQSGMVGAVTLRLFNAAGAVVATTTHTAVSGQSGWREVAITALSVTANERFMSTAHFSGGYGDKYGVLSGSPLNTAYSTAGGELSTIVSGAETIAGSAGNGVYGYGDAPTTPDQTFNAGNYAADVVFVAGSTPASFSIASTTAATTASTTTVTARLALSSTTAVTSGTSTAITSNAGAQTYPLASTTAAVSSTSTSITTNVGAQTYPLASTTAAVSTTSTGLTAKLAVTSTTAATTTVSTSLTLTGPPPVVELPDVTPAERTLAVAREDRTLRIPREDRTVKVTL